MGNPNFIYTSLKLHICMVSYFLIMTRSFSQNHCINVYQLWLNWSEVQVGVASFGVPVDDYRGFSQNHWIMLYQLSMGVATVFSYKIAKAQSYGATF